MSVQTTVEEINKILASIGFSGFTLSTYGSKQQFYKIQRPGSDDDAFKSLSEGEKNLVTLLYFTYLLRGSINEDDIEKDRVAVFDDPVSSLDSENLYYASSLIRNIIEDVKNGQNIVKQVFVMTHNVYFHKEITLSHVRKPQASEKYWIVRKVNGISDIEHKEENPISSVFELLWMEYLQYKREPARHHFITIQNIMRRLLEYYFKVLNGVDLYKICDVLVEVDKTACRSLIEWVHAGSHVPPEDHDPNNENLKEHYCNVFEEIFRKSGFKEHFESVMTRLNNRV